MSALDDLVEALQSTSRSSVFRLEGRQTYPDDELWQAHQRGEWWEQSDDLAKWVALVSAARDRGVTWTRVRVVVEPWTPYTRWEVEQHFPHNVHAGETIRLWRCNGELALPDFWMVDDQRAWFLHYRDDGEMTVVEATERVLGTLRRWRDEAIAQADPLSPATT